MEKFLGLGATKRDPTFPGTVSGLSTARISLGNDHNASGASKPTSTATQAVLDGTEPWTCDSFSTLGAVHTAALRPTQSGQMRIKVDTDLATVCRT